MTTPYTAHELDTCYRQISKDEGGFFAFHEEDFPANLVLAAVVRRSLVGKATCQKVLSCPGYWRVFDGEPPIETWWQRWRNPVFRLARKVV